MTEPEPGFPTFSARGPNRGADGARFLYSVAALGFVSVSGFVFNAILARMLPVEAVGHIRVIRTALDLWVIAAAFGLDAAAARRAGDLRLAAGERARGLVTHLWLAAAISALAALAGAVVFSRPGVLKDAVAPGALRWLSPVAVLMALYLCLCGHLQGRGWIKPLAAIQGWRSLILTVVGSAMSASWGIGGWIASRFITEAAALLMAARVVWRGERGAAGAGEAGAPDPRDFAGASARPDAGLGRAALAYGGAVALTQGLVALISSIDILALDRFRSDPREIAFYGVGALIFSTATMLPQAFTQSQFHRIAARAHDGWGMWNLFVDYQVIILIIAGPAALVLYWLAPWIAGVFGPDYLQSAVIFRWLIPAFIIWSAGIVATRFVVVAGRMRLYIAALIATALADAALNARLTPTYGAAGAVMSTTASYALLTTLAWLILLVHRGGGARPEAAANGAAAPDRDSPASAISPPAG